VRGTQQNHKGREKFRFHFQIALQISLANSGQLKEEKLPELFYCRVEKSLYNLSRYQQGMSFRGQPF
jgi:hypothetical protein